jgi:hypothetical protein
MPPAVETTINLSAKSAAVATPKSILSSSGNVVGAQIGFSSLNMDSIVTSNNTDTNSNNNSLILKSELLTGFALKHALLLAPLVGEHIVKPHPKRGFRQWLIKRSVSLPA